jgi:hypothetical protein
MRPKLELKGVSVKRLQPKRRRLRGLLDDFLETHIAPYVRRRVPLVDNQKGVPQGSSALVIGTSQEI